jgi:hypothetical protein
MIVNEFNRSLNDSDFEEYSFDEKQFLNVDENPSRNNPIDNSKKLIKTLQLGSSLKSSLYNHFLEPRPSQLLSQSEIKFEASKGEETEKIF